MAPDPPERRATPKSTAKSKSTSRPRRPLSIRPTNFRHRMTPDECGSLVIPLRRKGKLITYWAQGRGHCLNCKRCQSPRYKEIRLWQGRGMRGANVLTRVHQAIPLHALGYGCSRVLHYREVSAGARGKLVEALNSASGGKYLSLIHISEPTRLGMISY